MLSRAVYIAEYDPIYGLGLMTEGVLRSILKTVVFLNEWRAAHDRGLCVHLTQYDAWLWEGRIPLLNEASNIARVPKTGR